MQEPHELTVRFYFYHLICSGDQFCDPLQAASAGIQVLAGWKPAGATGCSHIITALSVVAISQTRALVNPLLR